MMLAPTQPAENQRVYAVCPAPTPHVTSALIIGKANGDDGPVLHLYGTRGLSSDVDWWEQRANVFDSPLGAMERLMRDHPLAAIRINNRPAAA